MRGAVSPGATGTGDTAGIRPLNDLQRAGALFLATFLLVFPKGGFKVGSVPVTWGYMGLLPLVTWFAIGMMRGRRARIHRARLLVLGLLLPFQVLTLGSFLVNGFTNTGFTISFAVSFFLLPPVMLLVLGASVDGRELAYPLRLVRGGIFTVAVYGLALFCYKLATGHFLEIPYLTVNAGDIGELGSKYNDRGGIFKLISTYNNGNIYGVTLLMLLPLYQWLERSPVRRGIVKCSLLLTLSRTVWAGLIVHEVLQVVYIRRPSVRTLAILFVSVIVLSAGVLYCLHLMGLRPEKFLLDRTLGGRQGQWSGIADTPLLPPQPFEGIREIVYLSMLSNFGLLGLASYLLAATATPALHVLGCLPWHATAYKRSLVVGLGLYLFVSIGDGAMLFIPVMAVFWFIVSLLLSGNPTFEAVVAATPAPRASHVSAAPALQAAGG